MNLEPHAVRSRAFTSAYAPAWRRRHPELGRFVLELAPLETRVLEGGDAALVLRCVQGSVRLLQDGGPELVLQARESYEPDGSEPLTLVALAPCTIEVRFAEEVLLHG